MFKHNSIRTAAASCAAICLFLAGSAVAAPYGWRQVAPSGAGFTAAMPGAPAFSSQNVPTRLGTIVMQTVMYETSTEAYAVMYGDYGVRLDPASVLENVRNGEVGSGRLLAETDISLNGYPGKRIVAMVKGKVLVSEFLLAGTRLYQVMYLGDSASPNAIAFLDSFRFTY